jgi:raffinose/stachyose/melibiose transport system permease protein
MLKTIKTPSISEKRRKKGILFALPAFLLHLIMVTIPGSSLIYYSLTDWNGLMVTRFVGLDNFVRAFTRDRDFLMAMGNTMRWTLFFMIFPIVIGLIVALGMTRLKRSQMPLRALFFMPYVISPIVVGRVFTYLYSPYGGLGDMLAGIGLTFLKDFAPLGDQAQALYAVAFADFWHWWGFVMVLLLAALHQVDPELYEFSDIEGAGPLQKLRHVTLPSITPTLVTLYMIIIIGSFLTFDYVYVMTGGGPAGSTEIMSTWIYKRSFIGYEAGYGSCLSLIVCAMCVLVYAAFQRLQRALERKGVDI